MSNVKRKDSKNRNLRNGESQRKDGRYVYKYTDIYGKPQFIYSWKLVPTDKTPAGKRDDISLREKEAQIKKDLGVPVVTDIHEPWQAEKAAEVVDILQIPAFLCRQTDLVYAAAKTGKTVNVKKGQFLAPWDMKNVIKKVEEAGNHNIMLTERGASFGYNTLVTDMRGLAIMRELGYPVVMDATHSVQIPGGQGTSSGGQSQYVPHMARAAAAVGIDALFLEVHDNPAEALSDGPNMVKLDNLEKLLTDVLAIDKIVRG